MSTLRLAHLDHVVLTVRSIPATVAFYRDALGMTPVTFGDGRTALAFGGQKINLHPAGRELEPKAAAPTPGSADLCFLTERPLAEWRTHLAARGVAVLEGPVPRTGAQGAIESLYLRDPDGNLLEVSVPAGDPIAPLRAWLGDWHARVRAVDFDGGRALCSPDLVAFGTRAFAVHGLDAVVEQQWRHVWPHIRDFTVRVDEACGAVAGDVAWVAAPWDSRGVHPDGSTFARPGRLTIVLERRDGRWQARHTHFSLTP